MFGVVFEVSTGVWGGGVCGTGVWGCGNHVSLTGSTAAVETYRQELIAAERVIQILWEHTTVVQSSVEK